MVHLSLVPRLALSLLLIMLLPLSAEAATPLFAEPLHLTREVSDPISGKTQRIEEYCRGNQVISISGSKTSIADYSKSELTEIDRAGNTYSVTRFDVIAKVNGGAGQSKSASRRGEEWDVRRGAAATLLGHAVSGFHLESKDKSEKQSIDMKVDSQVSLSAAAMEVLIGAAYPNGKTRLHEATLNAASLSSDKSKGAGARYGLPVERTTHVSFDGAPVDISDRIIRISSDEPSSELTSIPPGARLLPSRITEIQRGLEQLDTLPSTSN